MQDLKVGQQQQQQQPSHNESNAKVYLPPAAVPAVDQHGDSQSMAGVVTAGTAGSQSLQLTEDDDLVERSSGEEDDSGEEGCDADSIESSCFGDVATANSQTTNPGSAGGSMDSCGGGGGYQMGGRVHCPLPQDTHMSQPNVSKRLTPHYSSTVRKKRANTQKGRDASLLCSLLWKIN